MIHSESPDALLSFVVDKSGILPGSQALELLHKFADDARVVGRLPRRLVHFEDAVERNFGGSIQAFSNGRLFGVIQVDLQ